MDIVLKDARYYIGQILYEVERRKSGGVRCTGWKVFELTISDDTLPNEVVGGRAYHVNIAKDGTIWEIDHPRRTNFHKYLSNFVDTLPEGTRTEQNGDLLII